MAARRRREPDPTAALEALAAALGSEPALRRGYVLRGEERYFRERAIERIKARARERDYEVCAHDAHDPDFSLGRLVDDLGGGGLFAERRLVLVRNPEKLPPSPGEDPQLTLTRAVASFLGGEDAGTVVLSAASLRADHALVKAVVAAEGTSVAFRKLYDSPPPWGSADPRSTELVRWLVGRAREMGLPLGPDQAVYVAAATGNDPFALEDQLETLRDAPGRDPRELVPWDPSATPWGVADHLLGGDVARALAGVQTLFRSGFVERDGTRRVDAPALVAMLTSALIGGVRKGLAVAAGTEAGRDAREVAKEAGIRGAPSTVDAQLARAARRPARRWRGMLEDVADLERRAKSGAGVDVEDFTHLALRWSRGRAPGPGVRTG